MTSLSIRWADFTPLAPLSEPTEGALWSPLFLTSLRNASIAVLSKDTAIDEAVRDARERQALLDLVHCFAQYGLSWTGGRGEKISRATETTAQRFLEALPPGRALPKIAPDGERGLMMVWESRSGHLLVTIDENRLHAVLDAATPHAKYFSDLAFDGANVSEAILAKIAER